MTNTNYAIFIDLENAGGKVSTLESIIEKVKIRGNILLGKAYGYTDNFSSLKELLLSNTFNVVPSIKFGHSQKNNLDIQLVIDALEVAYKNDLIDCFCIVSGDSDYTPLVGKLKSMGKFVLGISRSEVASKVFINACNEFIFLENMPQKELSKKREGGETASLSELDGIITAALREGTADTMYASELKNTILRLRPDFDERSYGASSFSQLLNRLSQKYGSFQVEHDKFQVKLRLTEAPAVPSAEAITKSNWKDIARRELEALKEEGFTRVNPSVIKQAFTEKYVDFDERALGFRKFGDLLKALEKENIVLTETDEQKSMLVKIL